MVTLSFKKEWRNLLLSGDKTQTVRPKPKYKRMFELFGAWNGHLVLQIYINQRSPDRELLFIAKVMELLGLKFPEYNAMPVVTSYREGGWSECAGREIWENDGFGSLQEMYNWFLREYGDKLYDMDFVVIRFKPKLGVMCAECMQMHYTEQATIPEKCSNCGNNNPDRFFAVDSREARFVKVAR